MHPLLASRARLGAYLLGWAPIALLLTGIARSQGWTWAEAAFLAPPLCLLAALNRGACVTAKFWVKAINIETDIHLLWQVIYDGLCYIIPVLAFILALFYMFIKIGNNPVIAVTDVIPFFLGVIPYTHLYKPFNMRNLI